MNEQDEQPIQPARFTPPPATGGPAPRPRRISKALAVSLAAAAAALWFLFTAQPVLFTFEPPYADLDIDGGISIPLGERRLLRPGAYRAEVSAPGFGTLRTALTVTTEEAQSHHYILGPEPGQLSFRSEPGGAFVQVDGEEIGQTPLKKIPVAKGDRQIRIAAERYRPFEQTIEVIGKGEAQLIETTLEPAWATVAIDSIPPGAAIYIDGAERGATPAQLELVEGERQLALELPLHRTWRQTLAIEAGQNQTLEAIALQPADATVRLSTQPPGANVTVNGEFRGQSPLTLMLAPGTEHQLAVFKPGYARAARALRLSPREERELNIPLQAQLGEVEVQVLPADAEVLVDGKLQGRGSRTLSLPAFEQGLEIRRDGFRSHRQRFTPRAGIRQVVQVRLLTESQARIAEAPPQIRSPAGQQLLLFQPGSFTMGASRREPGRRANEVLHPVALTRRFYLAEKEVTNAEYRQFRKEHNPGKIEGNVINKDRQPVVMVSWNDAALYCNWLSRKAGLPPFYRAQGGKVTGFNAAATGYRLPTEAEWAWAARAQGGAVLKFPWGDAFPPPGNKPVENYADAPSAYITGRTVQNYRDGHIVAAPVGAFPPNHRGLYDMGGNVAEWTHDRYGIPEGGEAPIVDPLGAADGEYHVMRGASWAHGTITELRLSFRDYGLDGRDDLGFRIARFAEPPLAGSSP